MTTWDTLFNGYDPYVDTFNAYPNLYTMASQQGSAFDLYHQFVVRLPYDIQLIFSLLFTSIIPIVVLSAFLFVFFMPFLKRPQRW